MTPKVAGISANLANIDGEQPHTEQSVPYDYYFYDDQNFPPRSASMTPRLQAKIPKFFGWQMAPGYDYYAWLDSSFTMSHPDTVKWLLGNCRRGIDIATFKHDKRNTIGQKTRRVIKLLSQGSVYFHTRYDNEWLDEQVAVIEADKDYEDDLLANGGVFIYRNTPQVQQKVIRQAR